MVTRVIGIPDHNGVIRIACGSDSIEIQVVSLSKAKAADDFSSPPFAVAGGTPPLVNPLEEPFASIVRDIGDNPFELPSSYYVATASGGIEVARVAERVLEQVADKARADPRAVVLSVEKVDIHDLSKFGERIAADAPGVPIAVDFSRLLKG